MIVVFGFLGGVNKSRSDVLLADAALESDAASRIPSGQTGASARSVATGKQ